MARNLPGGKILQGGWSNYWVADCLPFVFDPSEHSFVVSRSF